MERPSRFEEFRLLGDKRTQRVYDVDAAEDPAMLAKIEELLASGEVLVFAPDTIAEARNRGYSPA